jgi:hypothetical protein
MRAALLWSRSLAYRDSEPRHHSNPHCTWFYETHLVLSFPFIGIRLLERSQLRIGDGGGTSLFLMLSFLVVALLLLLSFPLVRILRL